MNITNLFRISLKALHSNKFRSLLTMLGIIIGVASVIAMLAIGQGSKQSIQDEVSKMGSNMLMIQPGADMFQGARMAASNTQTLILSDYEAIKKQCANLSAVSPMVDASGQAIYGANNYPVSMNGVNADYLQIRKYTIESGRMFTDKEILGSAKVCLIGQTIVEEVFGNGVDPIGKTFRFGKLPFEVIGVLAEKGENGMGQDQDNIIIAPYTTVQKRVKAITYLNGIFASTTNESVTEQAISEIESILRTRHKIAAGDDDDFHVRSQQEMLTMFSSTTRVMTVLLAVIAGISLIVGGIGIMNIMYVSVTERTREIGLRMAVGARGIDILAQFLIEAVMISVVGGIIGVALGIGSSFVIENVMKWPVAITSYSIILSFVVCTFTGVFFGWYPARKAANLDPIDAIRYE
ncbi:MAG TPA: ABC transporter permease [Bacteroidales bacterium]|nr:ABC transporter permease [Bacteroidales bacterium]HPT02315.1 ABC transporter permease [Bacteroidales bacterium]